METLKIIKDQIRSMVSNPDVTVELTTDPTICVVTSSNANYTFQISLIERDAIIEYLKGLEKIRMIVERESTEPRYCRYNQRFEHPFPRKPFDMIRGGMSNSSSSE